MMNNLTISETFGNVSSKFHQFGCNAEESADIARNQIADLIGANSSEIIFTSGSTESNNLVIK